MLEHSLHDKHFTRPSSSSPAELECSLSTKNSHLPFKEMTVAVNDAYDITEIPSVLDGPETALRTLHAETYLINEHENVAWMKLLIWSVSDEAELKRMMAAYHQYFAMLSQKAAKNATAYLQELAYTLCLRRSSLPWKCFVIANSISSLQNAEVGISKPMRSVTARANRIDYVFTDQGAQ
jgi:hypothetical protein